MWAYSLAVLALWVINPELRRLYDWRFGFASIEIISVLPILALLPHVWSLTVGGGWTRLPRSLALAAWCWLGAFGYGLILGIVNGNTFPAAYAFGEFAIPAVLGLWVAADPVPAAIALRRVSRTIFVVTSFAAAYGIVQFVALPAWDALWLNNVIAGGATSFGRPEPFQVRVFSVLNAPGPFGNYLAFVLLFALPRLSLRRPWLLAQMPLWLVAFGLTLDRSGWLMFAVGFCVYAVLSPQRLALIATLAVIVGVFAGIATLGSALPGSDVFTTTIGERLATLTDLSTDHSASDRQDVYARGIDLFWLAPAGRGLGVVGTSAKLGSAGATVDFDSGFLARLIELGIPGLLMLCASWYLLIAGERGAAGTRASLDARAMVVGATVALFALQLSGDVAGVLVVLLWLIAACGARTDEVLPDRVLVVA